LGCEGEHRLKGDSRCGDTEDRALPLTLVALSVAVADDEAVEDDEDVKLLVAVAELEPLLLSVALLLAVADAEAVIEELLERLLVAVKLAVVVSVAEELGDAVADCR
jgi:hypothetical protein